MQQNDTGRPTMAGRVDGRNVLALGGPGFSSYGRVEAERVNQF